MANIRRSLAYTIADSYTALPLQLLGTMIISRLLTPAETGVFAVAAVFASLASTFRDFGVAEYLIQKKELRDEHIRASLTVNILISWAMGLLLFAGAPFAADFYRTAGIADVMRVQAFNFLLIPFGAVTLAYFRRQLDFRPIFICNLASNLTTLAVSVICAMNGLSYMSLAWSSLCGIIVTIAISLWFRPAAFPRWPGLKGVREVLHFGKFASGIYIFGQLGNGAPEMIIGRVQDMTSVALFSRGGGIVTLFNQTVIRAVFPVCLPYFAKNNREHGTIVKGYLSSISYLTVVGWPFFALGGCLAYSAIRIIYGDQWISSVPLTKILCLVGAISLVHHLAKEALISVQEVRLSNNLQIWIQCSRIAGLFAVLPFGLIGACYGLLLASLVSFGVSQWYLNRTTGLTLGDVFKACSSSALITLFSVGPIGLWVALVPVDETNYLRTALIGGSIFLLLWLLSVRYLKHPLGNEMDALIKKLVSKTGSHKE